MLAWTLTLDQAILYYEICAELNPKTEEERIQILMEMARMGKIQNLTKTEMTREGYIEHLSKNFKVGYLKDDGSISIHGDDPKENQNG